MANFITPVEVTGSLLSTWEDIDVSADVPPNCSGVILHVAHTEAFGSQHEFGIRKNGSTDNRIQDVFTNSHFWACIGVDGSGIFECWREDADIKVYLVGYFTDDAVFFTNAVDKSFATTGSFQDVNIATDTGGDTALAAILEVVGTTFTHGWSVRKNGSTDIYVTANLGNFHNWAIIGVDGSEIFEMQIENAAVDCFLVGYLTDKVVMNTNAVDRSTSTTGSYVDVTALPAGATGGIYMMRDVTIFDLQYALRKNGSTEDIYTLVKAAANFMAFVECDGSRIVEQKISATTADLFEYGYFEASDLPASFSGSGAATLNNAEASGSGALEFIAAGAATLRMLSVAAAGSEKFSATAAGTMNNAEAAANGAVANNVGAATATLNNTEAAASGAEEFTASGAPAVKKVAASATGTEEFAGAAAAALDNTIIAASGATSAADITGSGAPDLPSVTASASASETFAGSGAATLAKTTADAAALLEFIASSQIILPHALLAALGSNGEETEEAPLHRGGFMRNTGRMMNR